MDFEKYLNTFADETLNTFFKLTDGQKRKIIAQKEEYERYEAYYLLYDSLAKYIKKKRHNEQTNLSNSNMVIDAKYITSKKELWEIKETLSHQLMTQPDMPCGVLLKIIILACVLNDESNFFKSTKTCELNVNKFKYFFDGYSTTKRIKSKYYDKFVDINNFIENEIADPISANVRAIKEVFQNNTISLSRAVAICLCLNLDTFISIDLLKRAGYELSPYSTNKKNRALYFILETRPIPYLQNSSHNNLIALYDVLLKKMDVDIKLKGKPKPRKKANDSAVR